MKFHQIPYLKKMMEDNKLLVMVSMIIKCIVLQKLNVVDVRNVKHFGKQQGNDNLSSMRAWTAKQLA